MLYTYRKGTGQIPDPGSVPAKKNDRYTRNDETEEQKMLLLIAMIVLGVIYLSRAPRLAEASEARPEKEVRAYIDGKPVDSYMQEEK